MITFRALVEGLAAAEEALILCPWNKRPDLLTISFSPVRPELNLLTVRQVLEFIGAENQESLLFEQSVNERGLTHFTEEGEQRLTDLLGMTVIIADQQGGNGAEIPGTRRTFYPRHYHP